MRTKRLYYLPLVLVVLALLVAACGGGGKQAAPEQAPAEAPPAETGTEAAAAPCEEMIPIRLQLQWVTQSQFAGYYAAKAKGFYEAQCLDVTILEGAVEIVPQQVVASGDAEFGIAWVPKMLASREQGADLVNIAQVFQRSGTLEVSWADSGITKPEDWRGKRVGTWGFGNEFELYAAMRKVGIDPDDPSQVTIVQQPFDMSLLLNREIDAAEAMIYNEYAQVLEATNPETGELYQPEDLNVIDFNDVGTAMLQDHIFTTESYLADHEDVAVRFLTASFQGWIYCRDHFQECVDIVLDNGPTLGEGHMQWQLNEINALIWPSPQGIGIMDPDLWQQTVDIAVQFGVLQNPPDEGAYRTDLAEKALANLQGEDVTGEGFQKLKIQLTPGGEAPGLIEGETAAAPAAQAECTELTPIRLQLQWVTQSQFAGYYAAKDLGFFEDECLDVTILEGAVEIVPQQVVASGDAEFGIAWVPKMLASREQGADLVNIAQVFQRSGTLEVSWADSGITKPEDWRGKRVGTWGFGNEFELFAAMRKAGIDPDDPSQVTIVQQPFDMSLLLNREIDAAEAMIYNEYAQVLEAVNPETGELYQPEDLNVIDFNDVGTAMLQDHVFTTESYLADHEDVAVRFLKAAFRGWMYCRDHFDECVQIVLNNGPTLGEGHMTWQLNEINALIWPSPQGIGIMDPDLWQQTVDIAVEWGVLQNPPDEGAYRTDLAEAALAQLSGDVKGLDYQKRVVEITPGGE